MKKNKCFNIVNPLLLLAVMLFSITVNAQKGKMQTAFIYQLTRLIEWCPEGKEGNFVIAVVGDEPDLLHQLSALRVRRVGNQQIEVKSYPDVSEVDKANILFVPENLFEQITQIAQKAEGACTLIISDQVGSARTGKG
ncbi:MAG: YfiR family protein, partial [Bacteroidales bacterium]|nr:YfiR family protein [Bacteroidales bacterium]